LVYFKRFQKRPDCSDKTVEIEVIAEVGEPEIGSAFFPAVLFFSKAPYDYNYSMKHDAC